MKTKKKFWSILMMIVLVLGTAITFSSCGKDEEKEPEFSIVGTWADTKTLDNTGSYDIIVFKSNKTGSFNDYRNGKIEYSEPFEYSYSNGKALITWEGEDDYEIWNIEFFDSKTIMLSGDEHGLYFKQ